MSPRCPTVRWQNDSVPIDDPELPQEDGTEAEPVSPNPAASNSTSPIDIRAFAAAQRNLAAVDFSAWRDVQRTFAGQHTALIEQVAAAQTTLLANFAKSIDFSRIAEVARASLGTPSIVAAVASTREWTKTLSSAFNPPSLSTAVATSGMLGQILGPTGPVAAMMLRQNEQIAGLLKRSQWSFPKIDLGRFAEFLDRWIPPNLRPFDDLGPIAEMALNDGIPVTWIPRSDILAELLAVPDPDERSAVLMSRRSEILDDCETSLSTVHHEWAVQCLAAISAIRLGLDGPAQSHASNVIDSLVLALHGKTGRDKVRKRASEELDDMPLQVATENLTLRPLFKAFAAWWPGADASPSKHFARHTTAHAVGQSGIFSARSALVAVMLATSLTVQYWPPASEEGASAAA